MARIKLLSKDTIDRIAAGEVVTSPTSALKEILENSIDAGSENIIIQTRGGGKKFIIVSDDGHGIDEEDIPLAFTRNATSKITDDIDSINTLGFRGEALASIAFVSNVIITTRSEDSSVGYRCEIVGGEIVDKRTTSCNIGTTIEIWDLFYNTPARLKYLKNDKKETSDIVELVSSIALSHPEISFRLLCDGKEMFFTDGSDDILRCAKSIYGKESTEGLIPVEFEDVPLYVYGYISSASFTDERGRLRRIFINGRLVKSTEISSVVDSLYMELYSKSRPNFILYVNLPPRMTDVNIHPAKTEVKLLNSSLICMLIKDGLRKALSDSFVVNNSAPAVREKLHEAPKYEKEVFEALKPYIFKNEPNVSEEKSAAPVEEYRISEPVAEMYEETYVAEAENEDISISQEHHELPINEEVPSSVMEFTDKDEGILSAEVINHEFFEKLSNMKFVGNAFSQYAMLEDGQYLYAVDVHAAHERVLYERFLSAFRSQKVSVQPLMIPKIISLTPKDHIMITQNVDILSSIGFEIEDFGGNDIALRSIPAEFSGDDINELFKRIVDEMAVSPRDVLARNERLIRAACHNAVRGESDISEREVRALLKDLSKAEHPYTCPHGRSVVGKLSIKYFMKAFNRI
ncbi:MAG: DNA mismatch repair endonuclease MutL [Eubacteriaceae bacterium]|nr:DNA mismatch repair endonuclease MutL [Eubacteriaceae bacterium]